MEQEIRTDYYVDYDYEDWRDVEVLDSWDEGSFHDEEDQVLLVYLRDGNDDEEIGFLELPSCPPNEHLIELVDFGYIQHPSEEELRLFPDVINEDDCCITQHGLRTLKLLEARG